ncbi:hypothetical protein GCM10028796_01200 [Ramlibacter monticola]|uniref:Uncharacterized protein n=1 Tax=Ramlibacter monticola TaxID=1926872 RepID=A0A936Z0V3_9BURK|nr:hypothetical protein [Ramlibacter monticola]MBL0391585.1 hypothetical protein [Ramlibacter monticola]
MTAPKRISELARFKSAIVVSAVWSNMAGSGATELAMTGSVHGTVDLWSWADDCGPAERMDVGDLGSWRDAVTTLGDCSEMAACIEWDTVEIRGSPRYVGRLLALAWSDDEDGRRAAYLLCKFSDRVLAALDARGRGVWSEGVSAALYRARQRMEELNIEIEDLPDDLDAQPPTSAALHAALEAAIESVQREQEATEAAVSEQRRSHAVWAPMMEELQRRWQRDHPPRRAGGSQYPSVGWIQLRAYVERHILDYEELPSGVHHIGSSPDAMAGRMADLEVNFDELLQGVAAPVVAKKE